MDLGKIIVLMNVMFFILWGVLLLIKRKFMVSATLVNILTSFITIQSFNSISDVVKPLGVLIIILSFGILIMLFHKGKYIVYGVKINMISGILRDILKEEKISYEEKESLFVLKDYDDKSIEYKKSSDSVVLDLDDIRKLPFYDIIKDEIKIRTQEIEAKLFPKSGVIYILLGIGLLVFIQFLENTI